MRVNPVTVEARSDALLDGQRRVLEMIVRGRALEEVLAELCRLVEAQAERPVRASILLVDAEGKHLYTGAAPNLPEAYCRAIDGIAIDPAVGTCCAAAARREPVVTRDFSSDPGWSGLRHLPLELGLRGAWSMPILAADGSVLGTFGTYFLEPRAPLAHELRLVEVLARTAALAIERQRADELQRATASRHRFLSDLASATQQLSEPTDVMAITARMLAEHLGADRCAYAEVEDERVFVITGEYGPGLPSILGRWPVAAFGPVCTAKMHAGEPFVVHDVDATAEIGSEHLPAYRATTIAAVICVPLHKGGKLTAGMAVHQRVPRRWRPDEIELVARVVARSWETLERARVARTLQQSEARYRAMVEASPECVKLVAPDGVLLQINAAGLQMIEAADESQVLGRSIYELIVPEHAARFRAFNEQVCAGEGGTLEFDIVGRAGTRRTMETTAVPLAWPAGGYCQLAVTRDVTERVAAARALDESRERLARALESERAQGRLLEKLAEAALTIHAAGSLDSVLREVTDRACSIIGAHRAVTSLSAPDGSQPLSCASPAGACVGGEIDAHAAATARAVSRTNRPVRMSQAELMDHAAWQKAALAGPLDPPAHGWLAAPLVGHDGANLGVVQLADKQSGDFTDVDEAILVQLAQIAAVALENARLYDRLREEDKRKNEFLATLAHELRNPLAPIRTGLQILRSGASSTQASKTHEMMERQLGHMVRMVDDLLDVSRIKLGKVALQKQRMDFRAAVRSALETTTPLIEASGHALRLSLPDSPVLIDADPTRLAQVFANLLNNAAKYTPAGGTIEISAEVREARLVVRISDSGVGIPPEMLSRVFDMFTQVGRSIERAQGGLGIGLTLVRRLVQMHDGSVQAESRGVGQGTTFTVELPLAEVADDAREAAGAAESSASEAMRILVVDDNKDAAECLAMLLELQGHQTRMAHSGPDALLETARFRPQLVFLDIGLPGLSGYEVAQRIRADRALAQPLLVALTGWGTEEDRRQAHAAGFDRHLVKPFDPSMLGELVACVRQ